MSAPRNVLHVKGAYDIAGGPETLIRHIMQSMDASKHKQQVVILEDRPGQGCAALREPTQHGPPLVAKWHGLSKTPWSARELTGIVKSTSADLIHTHDMRSNLAAYLLTRARRVPWIASIHGWLGETHTRRWRWYEYIEGHIVVRAHAVMVGSRATQREVQAFGAKNVHVIHHGVAVPDLSKWQSESRELRSRVGATPDTTVIGVVARIHPGKGIKLLVAAIVELLKRKLDVVGVIAGEGPQREEIANEIAAIGLSGKIHMLGFVEDANPWMAAMDIVALPTLKDSFPFSVIDAVAMGKAVVTTTVGDLPLAVVDGQNGLLVPPGEIEPLTHALERLVHDRELRQCFGERGRKLIEEHFSPYVMAKKLEAMYASVLDIQKSRR